LNQLKRLGVGNPALPELLEVEVPGLYLVIDPPALILITPNVPHAVRRYLNAIIKESDVMNLVFSDISPGGLCPLSEFLIVDCELDSH
jgi:hypothetical protein